MHVDANGRHGTASPLRSDLGSPIGARTRNNSVTLDDPKVRLACEGLQALSTNERTHAGSSPFSALSPRDPITYAPGPSASQDERLATFLATRSTLRPWIDRYSAGKSNWPVFRPAVELVERGVTTAVDSVPRTPFVGGLADAGVRYLLTPRRPRSTEEGDNERGAKRQRRAIINTGETRTSIDPSTSFLDNRRQSSVSTLETLPAYDELSSPAYTETSMSAPSRQLAERFMITTSGFGAAVDQRKLQMLKSCLNYLRQCIHLVTTWLDQLDELLLRHERSLADGHDYPLDVKFEAEPVEQRPSPGLDISPHITAILDQLRALVQQVMGTIGGYVTGALPQSALDYIRHTILTIPDNWHRRWCQQANTNTLPTTANGDGRSESAGQVETVAYGRRVRLLAQELSESLQMVSGVMVETAQSAESWRGRMGMTVEEPVSGQTEQAGQGQQSSPPGNNNGDTNMTE
jgi:hypothetical protein